MKKIFANYVYLLKITVMLKKLFLYFLFFQIAPAYSQAKIIYLDSNWKTLPNEKKAVYYRPLPLPKIQNLSLLRNYYVKNKVMESQGYYADGIEENYVGEVFWYRSNGDDYNSRIFINKSKQKKLSYYFNDGKLWKTVEYGDSLRNGKTVEYKTDGSILGESIYKNGYLVSGIAGGSNVYYNYRSFNKKTKYEESIDLPGYKGEDRNYKKIYYWKSTLKNAAEFTYKNGQIVNEKNFGENGNLLQELDANSYFKDTDELKDGKEYFYNVQRSGITEAPTYIEYRSYPFSDVKLDYISHLVLYRGTVHFLEKHSEKDLYRQTNYDFFKENENSFMSLQLSFRSEDVWEPIEKFLDDETLLISVTEIESFSKEKIFGRFSKKTFYNHNLKNKSISETLFFVSPDFMGKTLKSATKTITDEKESALIYLNIAPGKYILFRENGGYFIPKKTGDIIEIPNFTSN
ncbi:hypothetical protein ASG21_11355 [Chryseobacterium sp. Leaf394]|nr:hypothetical protein ASG21_11355 [Chryseobacterium sp. Leaf394]